MASSTFGTSLQQPLQSLQIDNQSNNGLIGNGSYNVIASGNNQVNITQVTPRAEEDVELDNLLDRYVSKDALRDSFYSPPECHPNTRTTIRNDIGWWLDESVSKKSPLLWLNGPAAVGKSVIAKTVSGFHDQIVATFFFSTSSDKTAATLFPTLAWQLARRFPETRKHLIAFLKRSDSLQTSHVQKQFDLLIIQPLKSTTTLKSRPAMVIDGVDECTDERMLEKILRVLVQAGKGGDMPVRFIICSRPEPRIRAILGTVHVPPDVNSRTNKQERQSPSLVDRRLLEVAPITLVGISTLASVAFNRKPLASLLLSTPIALTMLLSSYSSSSEVHLPTPIQRSQGFLQGVCDLYRPVRFGVDKDRPSFLTSDRIVDTDRICSHPVISSIEIGLSQECKDDIARYLTDKFDAIPRPGDDTSPWFQPCDISTIVEVSCCQFLYASTIVRLLDEYNDNPREVLEMARHSALPTPDLNKLYRAILERAADTIRNQAKDGGPNYKKERRLLMDSLAILVFFTGNINFFTVRNGFLVIETLLGLERGKLASKLRKMHSVLRIVPGEAIQVHHRSFLEFLQSRERSEEYYISNSNCFTRVLALILRLRRSIFFNRASE